MICMIVPFTNKLQGMNFEDLAQLADALAQPKTPIPNPQVNLAEFKKLAELTLLWVLLLPYISGN